jgi:hypothetical protein
MPKSASDQDGASEEKQQKAEDERLQPRDVAPVLLLRCGRIGLRSRQLGRDIPPLLAQFVQQQVRMLPVMISSGAGRCCLGPSVGLPT